MAEEYSATAKVYPTPEHDKLSIRDMLDYFEKHGAMRVSDLHIKVGTPPAYRIDGDLVKLKGPKVTPQMAKQLLYPLLSNENMRKLRSDRSVDSSYRIGTLQFRINIFAENDGLAGAIRAGHHQSQTRPGPYDRHHRRRQIHDNRLDYRPNQREKRLPNHDHRRPDRVHI
ncbi:MAG: hypothetical protein ACYSWW_14710 [Planctomycetota bacterium]|jgi:hypothetical protein